MRLLVTGGTGFIGTPLCRHLAQRGHELLVLTRSSARQHPHIKGFGVGGEVRFLSWESGEWQHAVREAQALINLAGESVAAKRWTRRRKALLWESRIRTTQRLVDALAESAKKPAVLINASAVGYYGARGDEELSEPDASGRGFLAELCQAWEAHARRAERFGVRVVRLRIGMVLGDGGGALSKMTPPFRWFIGGPLGSGRQWVSWIHRDDVIGLIDWALERPDVSGPINTTAPHPVTMRDLCRELGQTLHRPSWAPVPGIALRVLIGEFAEALLTGQRVIPSAAVRWGYRFQYPELAPALEACFSAKTRDGE